MKTALYHIRSRCNYSQSMAAKELGVSRQMFSAWESCGKAIPPARKTELARPFGVGEEILDTQEESEILKYCDRPMFSRTCQGRQVFSFAPESEHPRVFLGTPQESRPEEQCKELMQRKSRLLENVDEVLRFDPQRQAEQLPDMEIAVSVLEGFSSLMSCAGQIEPKYRGRLLRFMQEQIEVLNAVLNGEDAQPYDEWQRQQIHLLRCRWGQRNRRAEQRQTEGKKATADEILSCIDQRYQQAKSYGWDRAELQWRLNQILEQEPNDNELD